MKITYTTKKIVAVETKHETIMYFRVEVVSKARADDPYENTVLGYVVSQEAVDAIAVHWAKFGMTVIGFPI